MSTIIPVKYDGNFNFLIFNEQVLHNWLRGLRWLYEILNIIGKIFGTLSVGNIIGQDAQRLAYTGQHRTHRTDRIKLI